MRAVSGLDGAQVESYSNGEQRGDDGKPHEVEMNWIKKGLLAVLLLGALSALAYIYFAYPKTKSNLKIDVIVIPQTRSTIAMLDSAIDSYMLDHSAQLPPSLKDLLPYLKKTKKSIPKDQWGRDFIYTPNHDQGTYTIASPGPDGILGTADDFTN